nr:hypothetical protein [Herbaspirillum sp. B39]
MTLTPAGSTKGPTSTARLILDTQPPVLDLDVNSAGQQTTATKLVPENVIAAGAELLTKDTGIAAATDISRIVVTYRGHASERSKEWFSIAGTTDVTIGLTDVGGEFRATIGGAQIVCSSGFAPDNMSLTIYSLNEGMSFTSIQAKTILEALRFKSSSSDRSNRDFELTMMDLAGNTSTPVVSTLAIDTRTPPTLTATEVAEGNQISYGMVRLVDGLGTDTNTKNLTKDESVNIPIPTGFTASTFLSAIKALGTDWGGQAISSSPSVIETQYRSYLSFSAAPVTSRNYSAMHQAHRDIKGDQINFSITGDTLSLRNLGGFYIENTDMYRFTGSNACAPSA